MKRRLLCASAALWAGCAAPGDELQDSTPQPAAPPQRVLYADANDASSWQRTNFGGEGEIEMNADGIRMGYGSPMTGVTWVAEELPRVDYRVELVARKLTGNDFFCCLTFPIGEEFASLVLGGWGGTTCGLSCIDRMDASENETTSYRRFEHEQDYAVAVQVDATHVRAWVDDEEIFAVDRAGKRFEVRTEVVLSRPLGVAAFTTESRIDDIVLIELTDEDAQ